MQFVLSCLLYIYLQLHAHFHQIYSLFFQKHQTPSKSSCSPIISIQFNQPHISFKFFCMILQLASAIAIAYERTYLQSHSTSNDRLLLLNSHSSPVNYIIKILYFSNYIRQTNFDQMISTRILKPWNSATKIHAPGRLCQFQLRRYLKHLQHFLSNTFLINIISIASTFTTIYHHHSASKTMNSLYIFSIQLVNHD